MTQFLLDFAIGLAVGFVGGAFGISGGIIAIPTLGLLGYTEQVAQGTSLVMQLPNTILGLWQYSRRSRIDTRLALAIGAFAGPCSYLGAVLATHVSSHGLRRAFALFLLSVAAYTLWNATRAKGSIIVRTTLTWAYAGGIGTIGGFLSGLFGIGGAAFAIPTLTQFFGLSQTAAQGMGLALVLPGIAISILEYGHAGDIVWPAGIFMSFGGIAMVTAGVAAAHALPERVLRFAFATLLGVGSVTLWIHG